MRMSLTARATVTGVVLTGLLLAACGSDKKATNTDRKSVV